MFERTRFKPGELVKFIIDLKLRPVTDIENDTDGGFLNNSRICFSQGTVVLIVAYAREEWNRVILANDRLYLVHTDHLCHV